MAEVVSIITALMLFMLGLLPFVNRSRLASTRLFLVISSFLGIWVVANTFADHDPDNSLIWTRLAFFAIIVAIFSFREFVELFPKRLNPPKYRAVHIIIALVVGTIAWTPFMVSQVEFIDGVSNVRPGVLYGSFIFYFLLYLYSSLRTLHMKLRRLTEVDRDRTRIIIAAVGAMAILASTTNLFLPLVTGNNKLAPIGSSATLIFIGLTSYAMVRRHLFDIRLAIARTVAYASSLLFLVLAYGVSAYLATSFISVRSEVGDFERVIYISFALLSALTFPYIKAFFDKATNRLFFRDRVDTQEFLDNVSSSLVSLAGIEALYKNIENNIERSLRLEFFSLVLKDSQSEILKVLGPMDLKRDSFVFGNEVLNRYDMSPGPHRNELEKSQVAMVLPLETSSGNLGWVIFGEKKNGNTYTGEEVAVVKIAADEIALAVENSLRYEQIEKFNETLQQEIEAATRKLKRTNEKLRALDEAKDEFISMASHQLRTPLTSVKGYISMVMEGDAGKVSSQQNKLLDQAFISSQRMVYLISDLLNVSRLKTGKFTIDSGPTYLPDVIDGELSQLSETLEARGLKIKYEKPTKFPTLILDETKTRQVIMNYIDNAMYYTPKGGKITVDLKATENSISLEVTDTGMGVPKDEVKHLFTKFHRAANAKKARPDGTGLGLFMAKKVIVAQGGAVVFKTKEGKGSTFGFTFPRKKIEVPT